ncbi:MAG: S-methyl-5'-thioadenosine phosphorylase [Cyanobacteria bacterium J06642_2]
MTASVESVAIGVIGGSGLYDMPELTDVQEVKVETPFGAPSDAIALGTLADTRVAFLARHGRTHSLLPSEVPFQANIYALKTLGIRYLISASAVGSLQEQIKPLDIAIPHQFIDRTKSRPSTFFGDGIVAHISFADPVCAALANVLIDAAKSLELDGIDIHPGGTYVCMEGPAFSTKAESELYRSWGGSIIGMTNLTEAKLAREAEIAYATLALVTDYDCWHPDHDAVTVEMVIGNLHRNAANAQKVIRAAIARIAADPPESPAHTALKYAILTDLSKSPAATVARLEAILAPYLPNQTN